MNIAPYGSWTSTITSEAIVVDSVRLGQLALENDETWWLEGRPKEQGRNVLVRRTADGATSDVTPEGFDVRTRVHEYGGGGFIVVDGTVYFSNFSDQGLYVQPPGDRPKPFRIDAGMRYADMVFDRRRQRLIAVREDHGDGHREAVNTLVSIDLADGHAVTMLASGADFYATPRPSPDGRRLAYLSWSHPDLPWDGTTLRLAMLDDDGRVVDTRVVAGGRDESIFQPSWSPDGDLVFVSDRSGWWNLYRLVDDDVRPVHAMSAEFGEPQWEFAMSRYGFLPDGRIVASFIVQGDAKLGVIDPGTGALQAVETPYREIRHLQVGDGFAVFLGGSELASRSVIRLDLATGGCEVLRRGSLLEIDTATLSRAEPIEFATAGGAIAHAFFYTATNADFRGPPDQRPPLLVMSHGGPTSQATPALDATIQYFTSRGIGVVDVNYRGSSGYGRQYRRRLAGQWGIADIDDCVGAAQHLVARGLADAQRLAIRGGSAGGYTTLGALAFRDVFNAGASYYGVGDLEMLARDTHKFESRYLDGLVGPYPAAQALYRARSPIHAVDRIASALILFQGLEDRVVPPNQSETMYAAVRRKGLPVAYLAFAGEQHGFRVAATLRRCLEAELYFYGRIFGFTPADVIEPVEIDNLS